MSLNPIITSGSPFEGFFKDHLPSFLFDKFTGTDFQRIEALYSNLDIIFDNIYQKLKNFPDELDVNLAQAKYLYQLGQLIGIDNIEDLSTYLDDDGVLNTEGVTQVEWDEKLIRQRNYVTNTIVRYLLKGTTESIKQLLYANGYTVNIRELWAEDVINGPYFEYNNALITSYGDSITGATTGDIYSEETFDLISEIQGDVVTAGISAVSLWETNNYNYQYVLDTYNNLYYKTSTTPTSANSETWYQYDTSSLPVSGDIEEFKLINSKIYIRTNINNLVVFDYDLDSASLIEDFKIDDNNCYFFNIIENGTKIFLDRGNNIEVRNISTYQKISSSVAKPIGNLQTIEKIILKKVGEYLIINTNSIGYILIISENAYDLYGSPTTYNLSIDLDEAKHDIFSIENDEFIILKYNITTNDLKSTFIFFDENYVMGLATSSVTSAGAFSEVNDIYGYSNQVLILANSNFGIYNLSDRDINIYYDYVTIGYNYLKVFYLDKFYFERRIGDIIDFAKIIGWNSFLEALYKSHYFDIEINIDEDSDPINEITNTIDVLLPIVKPIHTELQTVISILTDLSAILSEDVFNDDNATVLPISAGGTQYTIALIGSYDAQHPWKRTNNQSFKYQCDGIDGRPNLKYGETPFNFDIDTTNDELDNFIYTNTPEP